MKHKRLVWCVLCLCAAWVSNVQVANAVTVYLDKDNQGQGNKGVSYSPAPAGSGVVMTAKWGLLADGFTYDNSQNPGHTTGLVYVDKKGTGVWAEDYGNNGDFKAGFERYFRRRPARRRTAHFYVRSSRAVGLVAGRIG